jgi:FxsC-like protein
VPDDRYGDRDPYFFLAYAHTPEQSWVKKLYDDLSREILERTTLPVTPNVGFMDTSAIPLGSDWRHELIRALARCRVFVPLYSPRYFTREECGKEWNAFAERILDHRTRYPGSPAAIVPALWTPVETAEMPEVARKIQMDHADLGQEYALEGFYTLIKNKLYSNEYCTAVQQLAKHIIRAAETSQLRPFPLGGFGPLRNAFEMPGRKAPADQCLTVVVAAPTLSHVPRGRNEIYYGESFRDWNPYYPDSRRPIADYTVDLARFNSYHPRLLSLEEGCEFFAGADASQGIGLLLVDMWAGADEHMVKLLQELGHRDLGWVGLMMPCNAKDPATRGQGRELRENVRKLLPGLLRRTDLFGSVSPMNIPSLEHFRMCLPGVLEKTLYRYFDCVEAHPPAGPVPSLPQLMDRHRPIPENHDDTAPGDT